MHPTPDSCGGNTEAFPYPQTNIHPPLPPAPKTLFSTTFPNFQAPEPNTIVSRPLWLYRVVAIAFTLLIHTTRYFTSKQRVRQDHSRFQAARSQIQ